MRLRFQEERFRSSAINSKFQLDKFLLMLFAKSTVYFRYINILVVEWRRIEINRYSCFRPIKRTV